MMLFFKDLPQNHPCTMTATSKLPNVATPSISHHLISYPPQVMLVLADSWTEVTAPTAFQQRLQETHFNGPLIATLGLTTDRRMVWALTPARGWSTETKPIAATDLQDTAKLVLTADLIWGELTPVVMICWGLDPTGKCQRRCMRRMVASMELFPLRNCAPLTVSVNKRELGEASWPCRQSGWEFWRRQSGTGKWEPAAQQWLSGQCQQEIRSAAEVGSFLMPSFRVN